MSVPILRMPALTSALPPARAQARAQVSERLQVELRVTQRCQVKMGVTQRRQLPGAKA